MQNNNMHNAITTVLWVVCSWLFAAGCYTLYWLTRNPINAGYVQMGFAVVLIAIPAFWAGAWACAWFFAGYWLNSNNQ
jgi:hypothetical protein